jgi:hypothetical protein
MNRQVGPRAGPGKYRVDFHRRRGFRQRFQPLQDRLKNLRIDRRIRPHTKIQHGRRPSHASHAQTRSGRPQTQAEFPIAAAGNQPQSIVVFVGFGALENHNQRQ